MKKNKINRRTFLESTVALGAAAYAGSVACASDGEKQADEEQGEFYMEPAKRLPVKKFDVVIAGGGTAGVVAAIAASRQGAKVALIEVKGYTGGIITEGGTALHSFFNVWKPYPGVEKVQLVRGIPNEIIDQLTRMGGTSGHAELSMGYHHDSVCLAVDVEMYKLLSHTMLDEAGVYVCLNTLLVNAVKEDQRIKGVIIESRAGREVFYSDSFIDCTGYGDLAAFAGADYTEPNDYPLCNSMGVANVDIEKYAEILELTQLAKGIRSGQDGKIVRIQGKPKDKDVGTGFVTTTVHDNYFMFVKANVGGPWGQEKSWSVTDRDKMTKLELEARKKQQRLIDEIKTASDCDKAFTARTSPSLNIRRGRVIRCDYDISLDDVLGARHFEDEVMVYGFHDQSLPIGEGGGSYGIPYRALRPVGVENLLVAGMMITSNYKAHQSTRNTVSCMAQGQAVGTAAALCANQSVGTRGLAYSDLRKALEKENVYFES